jgi:activating signal cointegrator 1
MKAISLWQPWASAIPAGLKTIETRSWSTPYRGPLAIHAAKRWTKTEREFWDKMVMWPDRVNERDAFRHIGILSSGELPVGCIVATCELYACVSTTENPTPVVANHVPAPTEDDWGNFAVGRFAWMLRDIRRIVPMPCVGRQGFFDWTP